MFTQWLIARRESAVDACASAFETGDWAAFKTLRRRLWFRDLLLDAWTLNGRR